ncbi:MAG: hypothetical protein IAA31_01295 [Candidatus Anaerobiospirillum merdipullorum]|uniref:Uncharacterized protein n=1 Tax=Candidatus Anaerobiospirillum merdipullorum TaxID=2838450 RepID=A0A9E2KLI5_9GAMM|nr:hypothetical protein [Candidatus Anaerobiospirillum merdipullorum]
MTELTVTPFKIIICLVIAFATTFIVRFMVGKKRDLWFARSRSNFLLTMRGALGDYLALGYPKTWTGALILLLLLAILSLEIYLVLRFI